MHPASLENMERCVRWYLQRAGAGLRIADLGSQSVNGSYRTLFAQDVDYVGFDLEPGPGVDVVLETPYRLPSDDESFDLVISGQMLEHCPFFWQVFSEVYRVLRAGGLAFMIAPAAGPIHRYPVDCYRFYPDAWQAMADWAQLQLVHVWMDERGPWCDLVGVFTKDGPVTALHEPPERGMAEQPESQGEQANRLADVEAHRCRAFILKTPAYARARLCVEIGNSGVAELGAATEQHWLHLDPCRTLEGDPKRQVFRCDADDFFFFLGERVVPGKIDLAVIDGNRAATNLLRDLMHLERLMSPEGALFITNTQTTSDPAGQTEAAGAVAALLASERPELTFSWAEDAPLLMISGLRPSARRLWAHYNPLARRLQNQLAHR